MAQESPQTTTATRPIVGSPRIWARDFALMGAIGGGITWVPVLLSVAMYQAAIQVALNIIGTLVTHASFALLMGWGLAVTLEKLRGRIGFPVLWGGIVSLSALWGVLATCVARIYCFSLVMPPAEEAAGHFLALGLGGATMGAVVFGPLWLLYTMASVMRWRYRWLIVIASVLTGWLASPLCHGVTDLIGG